MGRILEAASVAILLFALPAAGQQPVTSEDPATSQAQAPGAAPPAQPASQPLRQATLATRTFTAPVGLLFNTVRPDRVADFEMLLAYVEAAFAKSTDETIRAQGKSWRVFKASEAGPNGSVLYVFVLDPTVAGADYGLGRILADAYPDPAELQQIWKLYTDSVTGGGSLLNLSPIKLPALKPLGEPTVPLPQMLPPK
jgi:hypothetical protein